MANCCIPKMATKRKAYTISTKLQAVAVAEKTLKEAATRQFNVHVDPRKIRKWCAQRMRLKNIKKQMGAKRI